MESLQPPPEERRTAQHARNGEERRLQVHFYDTQLDDQETETASEAQVSAVPLQLLPTPEADSPACRSG